MCDDQNLKKKMCWSFLAWGILKTMMLLNIEQRPFTEELSSLIPMCIADLRKANILVEWRSAMDVLCLLRRNHLEIDHKPEQFFLSDTILLKRLICPSVTESFRANSIIINKLPCVVRNWGPKLRNYSSTDTNQLCVSTWPKDLSCKGLVNPHLQIQFPSAHQDRLPLLCS